MGDDDLLLHDIASQHQLELEDREFMDQARLLTAVLIVGSNEDHAWSVENRRPRRQYVGRMNLLPVIKQLSIHLPVPSLSTEMAASSLTQSRTTGLKDALA